jgi:peptidoglycan hydrolase CwlO-like protein
MDTAGWTAFAGLAGITVTALFGWLKSRGETKQQTRKNDAQARRDIAVIANEQVELAFKYWRAMFDEREQELAAVLNRIRELTAERDNLSSRVRELGNEVDDLKRKRRRDQETIARLQTEIETLRKINGA